METTSTTTKGETKMATLWDYRKAGANGWHSLLIPAGQENTHHITGLMASKFSSGTSIERRVSGSKTWEPVPPPMLGGWR